MKLYYPMATYDGKTDNFHTLTTYDSQFTIEECLTVIRNWISMGFKIDKCWIQEYETASTVPHDIPIVFIKDNPVVI